MNSDKSFLDSLKNTDWNHALRYLSHVWTPMGRRALSSAIKRHTGNQQDFSYEQWIKLHEVQTQNDANQVISGFSSMPLISVVTPVYNVDEQWLRKCVESMQHQWYTNWELCLADDCSTQSHVRPLLEELAGNDSRIKIVFRERNGQISAATNSAIELASGDFIGFMDNDDELAPQALFEVVHALNDDPDTDFIYSDEDKMTEDGTRFDPFFKPGYSPNLLLGHNYITHFVVVSRDLLNVVGPLRSEFDGSQDYDFVLKATEQAHRVHHIAKILYHWRTLASSVAGDPRSKMYAYEAGQKALEEALSRRDVRGTVRMLDNLGTYKIDYSYPLPNVAVLTSSYSRRQFEKLKELTDYPKVTFVQLADQSGNEVAKTRPEELLVFLDGHIPKNPSWLREMVNYSFDPKIGAIGGKIFDAQNRIVNVGITLRALHEGKPFEMRGEWDEGIGYYFRDLLPRDMFAITEDCMLVRRKDFLELGGLNGSLPRGLRGIDYCVRLYRQAGETVLWQPYSEFVDTKNKHLEITQGASGEYLNKHDSTVDPFGSAFFPHEGFDEQPTITSSIDEIMVSQDDSQVTVIGWAADLFSDEQVNISLAETDSAEVNQVSRSSRNDVNALLPIQTDRDLGFVVEIRARHAQQQIDNRQLSLVFKTSNGEKADLIQSNPVESQISKARLWFSRLRLIAHPRSTLKRLVDKYWMPRQQVQAYRRFIRNAEHYDQGSIQSEIANFHYKPCISLLVPVYNVDPQWLSLCIESIRNQYYDNWELCLADDCSTEPHVKPLLKQYAQEDSRIKVVFREKNGHISRATNSALEVATGDFIALLDNDDELAPHALYEVVKRLNENPQTDLIYSDEDKEDEEGNRSDPHFKPDYSPDLLLSTNYISHLGVYRRSIVNEIGGFRIGYEGSQDYDLVLRFVEQTQPDRIQHIAKILYHWRTLATSTASSGGAKNYASDAGLRALSSALERRGIQAEVVSAGPAGIYNVHYAIGGSDLVSIIIPTKNGYDNIERCVSSIIKKTAYENYEIIIADNGSTNPHMWDLYKWFEQKLGDRFRVEEIDIPFNFSRINNLAAQAAKGKYLLFLNDDTEVISPLWMTHMVSFAQMKRVGVVGAKLYYPSELIQHAGIVLGLGGVAGHIFAGSPRSYLGYFGRLVENVNYAAVTAACCMVKTEDFKAVNGFDETLAVAYNDVDLCVRIHELGRDNVWAHEAELYHYESLTRGYDIKDKEKKERLDRESEKFAKRYPQIVANDPYYNPNLSRTSGNCWIRE